jgi:outer membrane protein TolC
MLDTTRAGLAKWTGQAAADRALPAALPALPPPAARDALVQRLAAHPQLQAADREVAAGEAGRDLAQEAYKPSWMVDVTYGARQGDNADGGSRTDFVSAMVTLDLPLFTGQRQDRRLAAGREQLDAAIDTRRDRLRELVRRVDETYASWRRAGERIDRYHAVLTPAARDNAAAALNDYRGGGGDILRVVRARIAELETRLELLRLQVDRSAAQATLLYLDGESQ